MADIFARLAYQATQSVLPKLSLPNSAMKYVATATNLLNGNVEGAASALMDLVFGRNSMFSDGNVITGGVPWSTLTDMFDEAYGVIRERTNLWFIAVEPIAGLSAPRVNLLATEASYTGVQLGWDSKKIGSGFSHTSTGAEPVELRITCYDCNGEIKAWFDQLKYSAAPPDGSFGLPSDYTNNFTVTHGNIQEGYGYVSPTWTMVPVSCEVNLSRSNDDFTALNLTFLQYDYFGGL